MLTHKFEIGTAVIEITPANPRVDNFNRALLMRKLARLFGDLSVPVEALQALAQDRAGTGEKEMASLITARLALDPEFEATFTIFNDVREFASMAIRIISFAADGWDEPHWLNARNSSAVDVGKGMDHYLGNAELWNAIKAEIAAFDRPNGAEGSPPDMLTAAERDNPLSAEPAKPGA